MGNGLESILRKWGGDISVVIKRWEVLGTKISRQREKMLFFFFPNVPLFTSILNLVLKEE